MGEIEERRLSVQETIEELERNKITLYPPVYDSTLSVTSGKKSPPDGETGALETPRNTIRVIKMNEAETGTQQNDLSGNNTNETVKMENNAAIEINFAPVESENKTKDAVDEKQVGKDGKFEEEKCSEENKKDLNTEKEKENKSKAKNENVLELKVSLGEKSENEKNEDSKPDNKSETKQDSSDKVKAKKDDKPSKKSEPLVPLTDEEIDKIVDKYADLQKDKKSLQKYLDFFFDIDRPHYGYFTCEMLMNKLCRMGYVLSEREVASMFCDLDADKDFLVSLDEYLAEMSKSPRKEVLKEEELRELFERLDVDRDGLLTRNDIEVCLKQSSVSTVPIVSLLEQIMSYDKSGNREKLDFDDFHTCYSDVRRRNKLQGNDWFDGILPLLRVTAEQSYLDYKIKSAKA